jgi:hypothetical protein
MGDTVFVNGRAVVHKGSSGQSIAFPDVCLCPPTPPAGPIPTPLPNTVMAADMDGGASSVLTEGNPIGKQSSFFAKSTGNEPSQPTGGGVITAKFQGKAYFQSYSPDVMIEGEPAVRHLDLLTHNHAAQMPGNTPPVPWLSMQAIPPQPPPPLQKDPTDSPDMSLTLKTSTGELADDSYGADVLQAGGADPAATKFSQSKLQIKKPQGPAVVMFRELRLAFWSIPKALSGDDVDMAVLTTGFPDGTSGRFEVRTAGTNEADPPLTKVDFSISENRARTTWKYEQPVGSPATVIVTFLAIIDDKWALSEPLYLRPYPLSDVRGVKQLLRALGYDAGPIDESEGGPLEDALRKFQTDHVPLEQTGKLDDRTRATLVTILAAGF